MDHPRACMGMGMHEIFQFKWFCYVKYLISSMYMFIPNINNEFPRIIFSFRDGILRLLISDFYSMMRERRTIMTNKNMYNMNYELPIGKEFYLVKFKQEKNYVTYPYAKKKIEKTEIYTFACIWQNHFLYDHTLIYRI